MRIFAHLSVIFFLGLSACGGGSGGGGNGKTDPEVPAAKSVYVAGNIFKMSIRETIGGYWKDGVWNELPCPAGTTGTTSGLVVDGNDVYVAGIVTDTQDNRSAGYWKNGNWIKLVNTYGDGNGRARAISFHDGKVYIAGGCDKDQYTIGGFWVSDGLSPKWIALGKNDNQTDSYVSDITVSNGKVYASGYCNIADSYIAGYWVYDSSKSTAEPSWVELTNSISSSSRAEANSILVSDGIVYVGGICSNGPNGVAGFWVSDGSRTSWQGLTDTNAGKYDESVNSIILVDGKICAGGRSYSSAGGYFIAGYWKHDGSAFKWNGFANPISSTQSTEVFSITINEGDIYLAASPYGSGKGSQSAGYYKNGTWITLTTNYDKTEYPNSMAVQIVVK